MNLSLFASRFCPLLFILAASLPLLRSEPARGEGIKPATPPEAAKVLNLEELPMPEGAEIAQQNIAVLTYTAKETTRAAFDRVRKELIKLGLKLEQGDMVTGEFASGTFTKGKFRFALSISAVPPDQVSVTLTNLGNVRPSEIPLPAGAKSVYSGPDTSIFNIDGDVAKGGETLKKHLAKLGWTPYGEAGPIAIYKQNGVKLTALISEAPGQGGKTTVNLGCQQMSANLPAPEKAEKLQYSDTSRPQISFDTSLSEAEILDFYRKELAKEGWKATTEQPIKETFEKMLIFYSKSLGNITVKLREVEGKQRVLAEHLSNAEWERMEKRAAEKKAKE